MKNTYLILFLIFLGSFVFGQDTDSIPNEEENTISNMKISIGGKKVKTRFFLLDLGINMYHNNGQFNLPSDLETYVLKSSGVIGGNIHLYRQRIKVGKGYFNFEHGLYFMFHNYSFDNDVEYDQSLDEGFYINNNTDLRRSTLKISRIAIPLMLHFETNPQKIRHSFHFGVGVYASLRLQSNFIVKYAPRNKMKLNNNFGLNDYTSGIRGEFGYGPINLYTEYSLTELFKEGRGPSLTPFSVGFTVLPF